MSCFCNFSSCEFSTKDIDAAVREKQLLSIEIEPSLRCSFYDRYSDTSMPEQHSTAASLTAEEVRDVVTQAHNLGAREIVIRGGEPMVYPDIMEVIAHVRGLGLNASVLTNGTGMTPEVARRLYDLQVAVVLKLNSFTRDVQNLLAGRTDAGRIITTALDSLLAAGYPTADRCLGVSRFICSQNLLELPKLWCWARERNIEPYFQMITPRDEATEEHRLDATPQQARALFHEISHLDRARYGREWTPQPPLIGHRCLRHRTTCLVNAEGDVMPCVGVPLPIGNVRQQKLAPILHDSEVMADLRQLDRNIHGPCARCDMATECYGCRGAAYQLTGDYLASDPLCWHNVNQQAQIERLPRDAKDIIPQRDTMQLVDRVLKVGERRAVVLARPTAESPFAGTDGTFDEVVCLEMIAQGMAAFNGYRDRHKTAAGLKGMLVGARKIRIYEAPSVGDELTIEVFKQSKFGDFGIIQGSITRGETLLAQGEIKVWHGGLNDDEPAIAPLSRES